MIVQFDTENADLDLTSQIAVLTHTPDASNPALCQGLIFLGDGVKDLDGTGGNFELTIELGSQTLQADPEVIAVKAGNVRAALKTDVFAVPANAQVILRVKSPNGADTDVDVTAYLYDLAPPVTLADDAITSAKYDESTAFPVKADDSAATQIARVGADGDTLETLSDEIAVVDGNVDLILADTGTDGVVVAVASKTGYALSAAGVDDILDEVVEGAYTMRHMLRLIAAALYGKASGGGTTTVTFRDTGDGTDRIVATVDASGNRTAVVLDET